MLLADPDGNQFRVLYSAAYWLDWNSRLQSNLVKAIGLAAATGFRFVAYRTWVFPHRAP